MIKYGKLIRFPMSSRNERSVWFSASGSGVRLHNVRVAELKTTGIVRISNILLTD
jgi:hypothetical protein